MLAFRLKRNRNKQTNLENIEINKIFKIATDKQKVICPPDQVFLRPDYDFLLTIGGDLVTDKNEYEKLTELLKKIGETEFYICENIGATTTERNTPYQTTITLRDDYRTFKEKVSEFEPPFGWTAHHFYVFGQKECWGIYICEYPTINIIGCDKKLLNAFREVFSINGNGYNNLKEFIGQEYKSMPNLMKELKDQYRLEYDTDTK